ncbi:hypothetical protein CDL15_Pgr028504 [Punica granatum]|uniref:Uncharacterized protein n=1 Tax=Punica granatum TaxID=22663 RepID=A0A218VW40_PUNGR|nr:hypothetical protein CDL15_Pgr028504 [Punica granatum]
MELRRSQLVGLFLGFLFLTAAPLSSARFVVEKNSLRVTSPDKIKGTYDSAIGNFGIPQYGGSMAGAVVYPKENQKGCKEFSDFGISFQSKPGALPTFVLVDRGDCFFALKVWNAQKAGASAVLVADNIEEALITMDTPEEDSSSSKYIENITIPSALIEKNFGETLKKAISGGNMVNVNLDWREAVPHPDDRVEYELWTNSNDECGVKCDMLMEFVKDFKGAAQILEKGGYTQFTPHYITWYCPHAFTLSKQCKSQCINHGRYCAPDPEQDFSAGYEGKDVVLENLRQLCVFKVANETKRPWVWWDYVTDFQIRCPMKEKKYNKDCADGVIRSLGLDVKKIEKCMGDPNADSDNPVLKEEQNAQVGKGSRGDVTILPTLVVNNRQYRGKLEKGAVLKATCAGFEETTEPAVCLSGGTPYGALAGARTVQKPICPGKLRPISGLVIVTDVETNECLDNNGGCWHDKTANITACKDTFRGRVCECPLVDGVQFKGDGYTSCEEMKLKSFIAMQVDLEGARLTMEVVGMTRMRGIRTLLVWILETANVSVLLDSKVMVLRLVKISMNAKRKRPVSALNAAARIRGEAMSALAVEIFSISGTMIPALSYMDSEIRAIMAQYMPLDSQAEVPNHVSDENPRV